MVSCNKLTFAQILTVFIPIGAGPFMAGGVKSVIGWLQAILALTAFIVPLVLIITTKRSIVDDPQNAGPDIVTAGWGLGIFSTITSLIFTVLYFYSWYYIFTMFECEGNKIISLK